MTVNPQDELDKAYASQIQDLFKVFVMNVTVAPDKDAALDSGGQAFQAGVALVRRVLAKAKQLV